MPSVHEIEASLITEGDMIESIVANRLLGMSRKPTSGLKRIRLASAETLTHPRPAKDKYDPRIVHISGHASKKGVALLGETIGWRELAEALGRNWLTQLPRNSTLRCTASSRKRVLLFSCCHSKSALSDFYIHPLREYFSGIYTFHERHPSFEKTLTTWSMFYREIGISPLHPHGDESPTKELLKRINEFFGGEPTLDFLPLHGPPRPLLQRTRRTGRLR